MFTGEYMFTAVGVNDTPEVLNRDEFIDAVNLWFLANHVDLGSSYIDSFVLYSKAEADPDDSAGEVNPDLMDVDFADLYSGYWETNDPIEFYTVKGSPGFALYWMGMSGASDLATLFRTQVYATFCIDS